MRTPSPTATPTADVQRFVDRWQASNAAETANAQSFVSELCDLLDVERPRPMGHNEPDYVFERAVVNRKTGTANFIDLYRKGHFVWENKQGSDAAVAKTTLAGERVKLKTGTARRGTPAWGQAMTKAKNQAKRYAASLPHEDGWPPFLVVCDVGHCIDLYADFSGQGKHYAPFPDSNAFRLQLDDLHDEAVRERLRTLWTAPASLDPSIRSARVTRDLAEKLGQLAKRLEAKGHAPDTVAQFLMRSLFSMFAEDVELVAENQQGRPFTELLEAYRDALEHLPAALAQFWTLLDKGGFDRALKTTVRRFNGELFADPTALPLDAEEHDLLVRAAEADWSFVEPAIFGTLLERALDPRERHKLGAHFTPRAYVERLVLPTIIEPLREDWQAAQALAAEELQREAQLTRDGKAEGGAERRAVRDAALAHLRAFHRKLCDTRVLDPACGSGNFLYVALEHMKRLEGEVLREMEGYEGQQQLDMTGGYTVSPDQFLGIELNPRAAAIAEVVLWIGYLQWHFRTWGNADRLGEPILQRHHNIENKDAVLEAFMGQDRMPEWPEADFIVGNPPFLGASRMREGLGDEYTERVRKLYSKVVPDSSDFVMYWWHRSAEVLRLSPKQATRPLRRFGLITTNSIRQTFNRRVLQHHVDAKKNPISIVYAIPDHPWVDENGSADVRVSMTVAQAGKRQGSLQFGFHDSSDEVGRNEHGRVLANLTVGADTDAAVPLQAMDGLSWEGVKPHGLGFMVKRNDQAFCSVLARPYLNGTRLNKGDASVKLLDTLGIGEIELRQQHPVVYQHLKSTVYQQRQATAEKSSTRDAQDYFAKWWLLGKEREEPRLELKALERQIVTVKTSKFRWFCFLSSGTIPDSKLISILDDSPISLAILSSSAHVVYSTALGGRHGVGNDLTYVKTKSFETFPFPLSTDQQREKLDALGEELDALRKRVLAEHAHLTMTKLYNVLEAVREARALTDKEQAIYDDGLVGTLKSIHDDIDLWTARAYGWIDDATALDDPAAAFLLNEQAVLQRLVDLNAARAADEQRGIIHYLRPDYQNPDGVTETQGELLKSKAAAPAVTVAKDLPRWSALDTDADRLAAVRRVVASSEVPLSVEGVAAHFKGAKRKRVGELVEALAVLGLVERGDGGEGWVG